MNLQCHKSEQYCSKIKLTILKIQISQKIDNLAPQIFINFENFTLLQGVQDSTVIFECIISPTYMVSFLQPMCLF